FEHASDDWWRVPDADWRSAYTLEIDNVRAALDWAFSAVGDTDVGVGLCGASGAIWADLSLSREGPQRLANALARIDARTPKSEQARLWFWLGLLSEHTPLEAVTALEHAVELYRPLNDAVGLGYSLTQLGTRFASAGRYEEALAFFAEALPLLEGVAPSKML